MRFQKNESRNEKKRNHKAEVNGCRHTTPGLSAGSGTLTNVEIKRRAVAVFFFKAAVLLSFAWEPAMKGSPGCLGLEIQALAARFRNPGALGG